jgi:predicted TIM-barrel fold metal-dependent hydrolase
MIALVTPITPTKTGSTWSPAELFTADPSYLEKVFASFVMVNLIIAALGLVAWVAIRRGWTK